MIRTLLIASFCSIIAPALVSAQGEAKPPKPATQEPAKKEAQKPAAVFVVAVVNGKYEVMNKEALEAKNKQAEADYKKAMEAFDKEKKAAEASQKKFEGQEPKKQVIATVGGEFASKEAAEAEVKKLEDAKKKEGEKKEGGKKEGDKK
jgi:hypothetical protein